MMTMSYEALRQFADSWGLALLTVVFVSAIVWAMRPGARNAYREQADIPFKHDEKKD